MILDGLSSDNDILKAEVQRVTDLRKEEQAVLAQKQAALAQTTDDAVELAIDKTLFRVWSQNPGVLNLDFLREELEPTLARWKQMLEEEAEDTVVEATNGSDEGDGDEASSLKTARDRLAELRDVAHEIFQEVPPAEPEVPIPPAADEPTAEDAPSAEDSVQK